MKEQEWKVVNLFEQPVDSNVVGFSHPVLDASGVKASAGMLRLQKEQLTEKEDDHFIGRRRHHRYQLMEDGIVAAFLVGVLHRRRLAVEVNGEQLLQCRYHGRFFRLLRFFRHEPLFGGSLHHKQFPPPCRVYCVT